MVEVSWSFSNLSPEFLSGSGKIWSRSVSTSWSKIWKDKVSGRCAKLRKKRRCRTRIKRELRLTRNQLCSPLTMAVRRLLAQAAWWRLARVLGRGECGVEGV
jgi:hypothetical protein